MESPPSPVPERSWDATPDAGTAWNTVTLGTGVRYVLPPRRVPWQRAIGAGIAVAGLVPTVFMGLFTAPFWWPTASTLIRGGQAPPGFGWFGLLALLFPLGAMIFTAKAARLGLLIGFGHSEVEVTDTRLVGIERCGPIRRRTAIKAGRIEHLMIQPVLGANENTSSFLDEWTEGLASLTVERQHPATNKRTVGLAVAYPHDTIGALASEIATKLGVEIRTDTVRTDNGSIHANRAAVPHAPKRPRKATGVLSRNADGISITLPARGFFRGSKGLGCFSLVWIGFVSVFGFISVGMFVQNGFSLHTLPFLAISTVFFAIGLVMFFFAWRTGKQHAVIDVVGEDLLITRQSVGAARTSSWHRGEIDRIVVGPSGMEVNDVPVRELHIWTMNGKKAGFFAERDDDELQWIAGQIRLALRQPEP